MRRPQMVNQDGEKCIMVLKNGGATTLKMAPASSPKEWVIFAEDNRSGPFSAPGDSGSVIVDGSGRMGGLLTGGGGTMENFDIYLCHAH